MNTFNKYELQRKVDGRLNLPDKVDEAAIHLIANGTPAEEVPAFLPEITPERVQELLKDPIALKRLEWKKNNLGKEAPKCPTSQAGYYEYALRELWRLSRKAEADKDKINALKVLAEIAKRAPDESITAKAPQSAEMNELLGGH